MVWKTRYSVRLPMHMIQPRKRSLWVWKLGSVKATAKACKRASSDGMIDHTEGGSWLLGECQRHGFNLKYTEVLPASLPRNLRKFRWQSQAVKLLPPGDKKLFRLYLARQAMYEFRHP